MARWLRRSLACVLLAAGLWMVSGQKAAAQTPNLDRYFYYPYHLFPHNYWPQASAAWPERPGEHYQLPPAYMAYPPFHEPHWRYDLHERKSHYRGFHFWLDAF
jgi:hypothetical protein